MTGAAFQISGNTLHHRSLDHLAIVVICANVEPFLARRVGFRRQS